MPTQTTGPNRSPLPASGVSSAPELPAVIAKQYDLHHLVTEAETQSASGASDPSLSAAVAEKPQGFWRKIGHFFAVWFHNPWAKWATLIGVFAVSGVFFAVPQTRYFALNTAGVRSSLGVAVIDSATRLPLKNVKISLQGHQALTDIKGEARLDNLRLGPADLFIERVAFAPSRRAVTIGWGSNPLGSVTLKATGLQYVIEVRDFISGAPLENVEASTGDINALSDKEGAITLTTSDSEVTELTVRIAKAGYRPERFIRKPENTTPLTIRLVPAAKDFYISNQSGKHDLYASDIDGQNKKVILNGTGHETGAMTLVAAPAGDWVALVSTRDPVRSRDGYLMQTITLINQDGTTASSLERAEQIKIIDWIGTKVIYHITVASGSAPNSQRNRIIAYDYASNSRIQLATANYFNAVQSMRGNIYYAVGGTDPATAPAFVMVRPDGSGRQTVLNKEVWTVMRTAYGTWHLQTRSDWQQYNGASGVIIKADPPVSATSRRYSETADASRAAWIDVRDGKSVINVEDTTASGKESQLIPVEGATYPLRWLNATTVLYRVVTNNEAADYVISTEGGKPHKIANLTHTAGFMQQ